MSPKTRVAPFITTSGKTFRVKIERFGFNRSQGGFATLDEAVAWRDEQLKEAPKPHSKPPVRTRSSRSAYLLA